jgi:uncharacterized protein (UPF0218 family)
MEEMKMVDMHSVSDNPTIRWQMPDKLRTRFSRIVGKIVTLEDIRNFRDDPIVCVGDVCTITILEGGIRPKLCVVDYNTKRFPVERAKEKILGLIGCDNIFWRISDEVCVNVPENYWLGIHVRNPPSTITQELWDAISTGLGVKNSVLIEVDGEEDLASLACISQCPIGTKVIYGIPNVGMQVISVDTVLKEDVNAVLKEMEVQPWK